MSEIKDGGSAFPLTGTQWNPDRDAHEVSPISDGMTLLDFFAAHANTDDFSVRDHVQEMRAEHATYTSQEASAEEIAAAIADLKYKVAEAMIKRRAR